LPNPWDKRALSDFCHSDLRSGERHSDSNALLELYGIAIAEKRM
jgi:hypothetical protein